MSRGMLSRFALAVALTFAMSSLVWAHDNHSTIYGRASASDYGRQNGYRDGYRHGLDDRRARVGFNANSYDYRRGDSGYSKWMGSKGQYKQGYRDAYRQGYESGFNAWFGRGSGRWPRDDDRDGRWGRERDNRDDVGYGRDDPEGRRIAADYGYRDGVWYAQQDQARHRRVHPTGCKGFQDADHGYSSHYDREEFKRAYRDAFVRGYDEQFRGGVAAGR